MTHRLTLYQSREAIDEAIGALCDRLVADNKVKGYTALVLMDGAETFFNRLNTLLKSKYNVYFEHVVKISIKSYEGNQSTGKIQGLGVLDVPSLGNKVMIIDDILETGTTLEGVLGALLGDCPQLSSREACSCMLFYKELDDCWNQPCCDYYGMKIRNEFVVGYGLDYNGLYRGLDGLYILSLDH